jgi:TrmH family RNA methyltransferase
VTRLLAQTRLVLVQPSLPENVGAVARSMHHFGLSELVIAGEGVDPLHPHAVAVSAGAEGILAAARRVPDLEAAIAGTLFAVATTARPYDDPDLRTQDPRAVAVLARGHAQAGPVALVFGPERTGLTKDQLRTCHQLVRIPGTEHACLNLAMAVAIMGYEWYRAALEPAEGERLPALAAIAEGDLDQLADTWRRVLERAGILRPASAESKVHTLKRMLSRWGLDPDEAALLRAIARRLPSGLPPDYT